MAKRTYQRGDIIVHWDSSRCIHSGRCLRGLPEVFDLAQRPWVDLDGADEEAVAATIETCPSGALRYEWVDGSDEEPDEVTTIVPMVNGPLQVRGNVEVRDMHGDLFDAGPRMTLCRCGHSQNQPFCDNSHREAGFRDRPRVVKEERSRAEHPGG